MKFRSRLTMGLLVVAALVLMSELSWAIRDKLPASKDEYGLKYDVEVRDTDSNTLTVVFMLSDEGRLKPIYSVDLIAFSKQLDSQGGRTYDVNVPIKLKPNKDGKPQGQAQIRKEFVDRATIRIITLTVDGKKYPTNGGAYCEIPVAKYLNKALAPPLPIAAPPASKVTR